MSFPKACDYSGQHKRWHGSALIYIRIGKCSQIVSQVEALAPAVLTVQEQKRFEQMKSDDRRRQFVASRAFVRSTLAELGGDYAGLYLQSGAQSAPQLWSLTNSRPSDVHLSLSHSDQWVAIALGACRLGVDIQQLAPRRQFERLIETICHATEVKQISQMSTDRALVFFHQLWAMKEAWFKANDEALSYRGFRRIMFSPATRQIADTLTCIGETYCLALHARESGFERCDIPSALMNEVRYWSAHLER